MLKKRQNNLAMKYSLLFISILLFAFVGCSEKSEKKTGPRTPDIKTTSMREPIGTQLLPDTVMTLGNLAWHSNVKEAFALAKKENMQVIIMVGEDNCRWCVKMKKNTLMDNRIQAEMQKYILISIKRSDKEAIKYVPEFDGNIPSFFFMTNKKEVVDSVVGYFKPDDFLEYINEIEEL
jgi:thioredoxin-related protein